MEPDLQPLTGEVLTNKTSNASEGARLDVSVKGFWGGRQERTFLDVRVFNPHAPSNKKLKCYKKHENEKKRVYEERIKNIEHSILHSTRPFCHRWYGQAVHNFLQEVSLPPSREKESALLFYPILATCPPFILPPEVSNTVYSWCTGSC